MNSDGFNKWLTLGANIGVLFGLFLVAYEIRQTNTSLDRDYDVFKTEVQGRAREGWREFNGRIIESEEVADIWMRGNAGEPLSPNEAVRYGYLANDLILLYQLQFDQYQLAGRDLEVLQPWLESGFADRPGLRERLVSIVNRNPDSEFSKAIRATYSDRFGENQD